MESETSEITNFNDRKEKSIEKNKETFHFRLMGQCIKIILDGIYWKEISIYLHTCD